MTTIDPRRPVLVAAGQHTQRVNLGEPTLEPAALLAAAARAALADAGPAAIASSIDSIRLVRSLFALEYPNAPLLVARLAGIAPREHVVVLLFFAYPLPLILFSLQFAAALVAASQD